MFSELYQACEARDIDLLRALIATSPSKSQLNQLEPNGSTALHLVCSRGDTEMIRVFLNEFHLDRHRGNRLGQTAYDISSKEVRQLFRRPNPNENPFCTDEKNVSPLEVLSNSTIDDSSHWLDHQPNESPILTELYLEVVDGQAAPYKAIFYGIASFFGYNPLQKQLQQWSRIMNSYVAEHFTPQHSFHSKAAELLKDFFRTDKIECLFTLYTLDQRFCQYLAQDLRRTQHFFQPIKSALYTVENRSHIGHSYRGLKMNATAFRQYERAFERKGSFIRTKTFCSTSIDRAVAEMFTGNDHGALNVYHVLITFHFPQRCSTAITLFSNRPGIENISQYDDEREVLLLPGIVFSVQKIDQCSKSNMIEIYLEHYNTDEEVADMHRERLQSFIDSIID